MSDEAGTRSEEKTYTISEAAEKCGLTAYAIRFYDREGLLPFLQRAPGGSRIFTGTDISILEDIHKLRNLNMPVSQIREYAEAYAAHRDDYETFFLWCREFIRNYRDTMVEELRAAEKRLAAMDDMIDRNEAKFAAFLEAKQKIPDHHA